MACALAISAGIWHPAAVNAAGAIERSPPAFVPGLPDVPLMRGLDLQEDATVIFDKPNGRIVEAAAVGPVATAAFLSYYRSALPELGWSAVAPGGSRSGELSFRREGEALRIEFALRGHALKVRFFLSPD